MNGTKYWTWHMTAGVVILFLLGLHMCIMHVGVSSSAFSADVHQDATAKVNSLFRDGNLFFTITYVLLLAVALYHGLYGLRTILFELTLQPAVEKSITVLLVVIGIGLFGLGTWAAVVAHGVATHAAPLAGLRG